MGHFVGSGNQQFFVEEDGTYWNGPHKTIQYDPKTFATIRMVKLPTEQSKEKGIEEEKEIYSQGVVTLSDKTKAENQLRFKELTTPAGENAKRLLSNGGLNHSAFTKSLGLNSQSQTDKSKTRVQYNAILKELQDNDLIKKEGYNYFYKD